MAKVNAKDMVISAWFSLSGKYTIGYISAIIMEVPKIMEYIRICELVKPYLVLQNLTEIINIVRDIILIITKYFPTHDLVFLFLI
jgi:hypothetical protein